MARTAAPRPGSRRQTGLPATHRSLYRTAGKFRPAATETERTAPGLATEHPGRGPVDHRDHPVGGHVRIADQRDQPVAGTGARRRTLSQRRPRRTGRLSLRGRTGANGRKLQRHGRNHRRIPPHPGKPGGAKNPDPGANQCRAGTALPEQLQPGHRPGQCRAPGRADQPLPAAPARSAPDPVPTGQRASPQRTTAGPARQRNPRSLRAYRLRHLRTQEQPQPGHLQHQQPGQRPRRVESLLPRRPQAGVLGNRADPGPGQPDRHRAVAQTPARTGTPPAAARRAHHHRPRTAISR